MVHHHHVIVETADEYNKGLRALFIFIFLVVIPILLITLGYLTKINYLLLLGVIWLGLVIYFKIIRKMLRPKNNFGKQSNQNSIFSLKIFIVYWITFIIGYWASTYIIPSIKVSNIYIIFILTGLCLELSAKVVQMLLYRKASMVLDKYFLLWVLIHSVVVYGVILVVNSINISNIYLSLISIGFGIALITHIIWRFMYNK